MTNAILNRENQVEHPADAEFHSLLVLTTGRKLYQVEVEADGRYQKPVREILRGKEGYRKVLNIAEDSVSGTSQVAVALLPIKDEPNSGFICCYLANAARLDLEPNAAARWRTAEPTGERHTFKLLVARTDPGGVLNQIAIDSGTPQLAGDDYNEARKLLAQGCIAGEVKINGQLVPLVNLASLRRQSSKQEVHPVVATVNPRGKVYAAATEDIARNLVREPALAGASRAALAIVEKNQPSAPAKRSENVTRRNAAQGANIAVAILPLSDADIGITQALGSEAEPVILFNALRLNVRNVWTVAEWSDQNQVDPLTNEIPPNVPFKAELPSQPSKRLFVAVEPGTIYDIDIGTCSPVSADFLRKNTEVWRLLRNGCLAGGVVADGSRHELINLAAFGGTLAENTLEPRQVLASTWDFKWPAGKTLRVKFAPVQKYSTEIARALQARVETLASSWTAHMSLALDFKSQGDEYDILVDLNDLPIDIAETKSRAARTVTLPFSEIGSYAKRTDDQVPTIYLGFPKGIKGESGVLSETTEVVADKLNGYFGSSAFAHIVLHEFGHALGLPHLHQSPDLFDPFLDEANAKTTIKDILGLDLSIPEILEELKSRWSGPGAGPSTDWYDVTAHYAGVTSVPADDLRKKLDQERQARGEKGPLGLTERALVDYLASNSVMMGLPVRSIYKGSALEAADFKESLGDIDIAWIKQLYPPSSQT